MFVLICRAFLDGLLALGCRLVNFVVIFGLGIIFTWWIWIMLGNRTSDIRFVFRGL